MKKKYLVFLLSLFILFSFIYFFSFLQINIFYTNDLHGRIEVLPKVAYYVKKTATKNYLILDDDDFIQGTPESNFFKG